MSTIFQDEQASFPEAFDPCAEPTIDSGSYFDSARSDLRAIREDSFGEWDTRKLYSIATEIWTALAADKSGRVIHDDWHLLSLALLKLGRDNEPAAAYRLLCRVVGMQP